MIQFQGVEKVFGARAGGAPVHALAGIDLTIGRGEIFGIIGRSGAGKSTLIRIVNGLERPTGGAVLVDGVAITALDAPGLRQARRGIGMIFQHFNLLSSRTVHDNVALPLELAGVPKAAIRKRVEPLLELVGLADKRDRYPAELSGGQKQRVGIARALANEPKVLLSDEATSALDPETTTAILRLLADINRQLGLTIMLITHEMTVIKEICHRVAVMEGGRVIEDGRVFDVFTQPRHDTTRSFIASVMGGELPDAIAQALQPGMAADGSVVLRLTFRGEWANRPVVSAISRQFGLDLNLLYGRLDQIQGAPFGTLVVEVAGAAEALQAAIHQLQSYKVAVEVLGHVPGNRSTAA